jgi:hypothetical protein
MPKLKGPQDAPNESTSPFAKADPWSGSWGKINPSAQSTQTLRLCKGSSSGLEESFSYPYRTLSSWQWRRDTHGEQLKIEAGPDAIVIRGRGLVRLMDALDISALETVRESSSALALSVEETIAVESLTIEKTHEP